MVSKAILLFLFGTTVTAGPIISPQPTDIIISKYKQNFQDVQYLPPSGHHPFIANFIQKGTNVFFKPQFAMSSAGMPPQVQHIHGTIGKEDCETPAHPHFILEEPLHVIENEIIEEPPKVEHIVIPTPPQQVLELEKPKYPVIVPPAPLLPPMEMPSLPVIVEDTHVNHEIPCDPPALVIGEMKPVVLEPPKPIIVEFEETKKPIVVPPAPILPPMEIPHLPVLIEDSHIGNDLPCEPVVVAIEKPNKHIVIPPAPLLPPMKLPELPVFVEESHVVPEPPCPTTVVKGFKPIIIPEPPKQVIFEVDNPIHHVFTPVPKMHSMPILLGDSHRVHELPKAQMHLGEVHAISNISPHHLVRDSHPTIISNFFRNEHIHKTHIAQVEKHHKFTSTLSELRPYWH